MRNTLLIFVLMIQTACIYGQQPDQQNKPVILSRAEVNKIFNDSVKNTFQIGFHIYRVVSYSDKTGKYYTVFTENNDQITAEHDTLNSKIKGFNFKVTSGGLEKTWEVNDFTIKQKSGDDTESSIWFWTSYSEFQDADQDGIIDPIIVYGSSGSNGTDDGRIKIMTVYNGNKIFIRHQNSELDFGRYTEVDQSFYALPAAVQNLVTEIMQRLTDANRAIFPYNWQNAMKQHKLKFDEKH